ncbi:MAG: hypothetical protein FWF68_03285 [Spirochaetes bacterium]|nr:hypothetical protein [Spirochaetota bacterium]
MKDGVGIFLWKISVALYLIANGILGLQSGGDFRVIFNRIGFGGSTLSLFVTIASVIALVAGIAILLEMFNIRLSFLDTLIFIIAIIWAVYVVIEVVSWVTGGFKDFWHLLQMLAVHIMVLGSLLVASKKIG